MKTISRTTMRRLLPVNVVVIALIAMSTLFVPQQSASPVGAASGTNSSASTRLFDPDMGKAARSQGNAFTKGPEGPTKTYDQEQYEIRAFPGQSIPTGGYANAAYQYNLVNDYTFPGGWRELGPRLTPNGNFFAQPAYPVQRTTVSGRATAFAVVPSSCSGGNCQIQYLGTANGGVWKTTNGGQTWQPLFDHNLQTSIGGITLDPVNPNIVYVGTGEGNNSADSNRGIGIYRSIDGGIHWTLLGATDTTDGIANVFVNRSVTRIVVDPRTAGGVNPTLYVGTTTGTLACNFTYDTCTTRPPGRPPIGFFFSKDGGQTWQMANPPDVQAAFGPGGDRVNDLLMDPSNPNVLYAAFAYYGVYRTTTDAQPASGGVGNWVRLPNQPAPGAFYRVTIDFAQSTANQVPQIMYAAYNLGFNPQTGLEDCSLITNPKCSVSGPEQIYRIAITAPQSPNGGAQFTAVPNPTACGAPGGSQCWYDMPLKIDPTNPNIVYAGGSANYGYFFGTTQACFTLYPLPLSCNASIMKTTDGGQTWRDISLDVRNVAVHPDNHFIFISPNDPSTLWTEDDGGNFRANGVNAPNGPGTQGTPAAWNDENPGVGSLQFIGIGVGPTDTIIGGTQDNGTFLLPQNTTTGQHVLLGDGGQGVADPNIQGLYYSEEYGATMFRLRSPSCDFQTGPFPGGYPNCGQTWIAPFAIDFFTYGGGSFYEPQTTAFKNPDGTAASNNIFHATFRLWRSQDYGGVDVNNDGDAVNDPAEQLANPSYWVPISGDLSCGPNDTSGQPTCGGNIVFVTVAPNDPNTVVVGVGPSFNPTTGAPQPARLYITHNALAPVTTNQGVNYCPPTTFDPDVGDYVATCNYQSGVTWTEIDAGLPNRVPTEVAFAPHSTTHFYVTLSGFGANTPGNANHVFETTNNGLTWNPLDTSPDGAQFSLPDMPFNSIQVNQNNGHLYTAADIGVFVSINNGRDWQRDDMSLANVPVYQLRLDPTSTSLYASTHGRGIWVEGAP